MRFKVFSNVSPRYLYSSNYHYQSDFLEHQGHIPTVSWLEIVLCVSIISQGIIVRMHFFRFIIRFTK